ncbi:MAG: cation acetate symporter [Pseudomonadota bacterium]
MNIGAVGIGMFAAITALTLVITYLAGRRLQSADAFYRAGGGLPGVLNGVAISGDFLSATTLLGITGLYFISGFDAAIYLISPLIGLLLMLGLLAGPIRELGRYTLADILAQRFDERPMRILSAINTLTISLFYLIVQMVGAGALIETIFHIPYHLAVTIVGALMTLYVAVGGMVATTWVQISKACLLVLGVGLLSGAGLLAVGFDLTTVAAEISAHRPSAFLGPGTVTKDAFASLSLAAALLLGMCGLPHVLIRLLTVKDAHESRVSVAVTMSVIAFVFLAILFLIGPLCVGLLQGRDGVFVDGQIVGGSNMTVLHLSNAIGGSVLAGFIAAVVFATILAVVAGLTMACVGTLAHDLYARVLRADRPPDEQELLRASRASTLLIGLAAIVLGLGFEGQNLAYLVGLVFSVSASANFPILLIALYTPHARTRTPLAVGATGLIASLSLVIAGPAVWVDVLGNERPLVALRYPALPALVVTGVVAAVLLGLDRRARRSGDG